MRVQKKRLPLYFGIFGIPRTTLFVAIDALSQGERAEGGAEWSVETVQVIHIMDSALTGKICGVDSVLFSACDIVESWSRRGGSGVVNP